MRLSHSLLPVLLAFTTSVVGQRPTVTIASGVVVGTTTRLPSATAAVNKFIGVPYADSPPLRFAPPQPPPSWTHPLDAVETKPSCLQQFDFRKSSAKARLREMQTFYFPAGPPKTESEDCMYLNIYTPPGTTASSGKTVMFWVFGGNQQFGGGGFHYWDGTSFAYNQDVIVVTVSRRTNVFGFPASPEIPKTEQNVGFLDLRFALAWVQDNIANFGGDPSKVTIFGESSGATDVKMLLALPPKPVPFRGVIMESEASSNIGNGPTSWTKLLKLQNCDKAKSGIQCLRGKTALSIQNTLEHNHLIFPPTLDHQTYVLDTRPYISNGSAAAVPFMIGTNADEGRPFVYDSGLDDSDGQLIDFLAGFFPGKKSVITSVLPLTAPVGQLTFEQASKVITDLLFVCRTAGITQFAQSHGYQVWRYLYDAQFPNLKTFPDPGVFHSSEIPIIFGTYPMNNATALELSTSRFMQTTWATFAKNPAGGPGWPELGSGVGNVGMLTTSGEKTVSAAMLDLQSNCEIYSIIIDPRGF